MLRLAGEKFLRFEKNGKNEIKFLIIYFFEKVVKFRQSAKKSNSKESVRYNIRKKFSIYFYQTLGKNDFFEKKMLIKIFNTIMINIFLESGIAPIFSCNFSEKRYSNPSKVIAECNVDCEN